MYCKLACADHKVHIYIVSLHRLNLGIMLIIIMNKCSLFHK